MEYKKIIEKESKKIEKQVRKMWSKNGNEEFPLDNSISNIISMCLVKGYNLGIDRALKLTKK